MTKPRDLANSVNSVPLGWLSADAQEFTDALAAGLLDDTYSLV